MIRKRRRVLVPQSRIDSLLLFLPVKSICQLIDSYCSVSVKFVAKQNSHALPLLVQKDTTFTIAVCDVDKKNNVTVTVSIPRQIRSCLPGLPGRNDFIFEYGLHDDIVLVIIRNQGYA